MMDRGKDGLWAAPTAGASLARQNGKTDGIEVPRICYGMAVNGEWVLYTAQLQKTATETFERARDIFESSTLKSMVKAIHTAIGRESIDLKNDARIKFLARTRNGGRGQHADLLVFDEAQELTDAQLESFAPVISASRNPQTLYLGTPPTPESPGTVFRRVREEAHAGAPLTYWAEWSVSEIPTNTSDETFWAETNPSLGVLILPRTIAKEATELSSDGFARERLGWWSPERASLPPAIDPNDWDKCATNDPPQGGKVACGVKFSPDGSTYSISMAARPNEGPVLVECKDDLADNQKTVMAKFLDPSMPSVVSQADAAVKVASAAPWFAESDEFLRMLGFDEATIRQLAGTKATRRTQDIIEAFGQNGRTGA